MQRRTLFKSLSLLFLPLVRVPRASAATLPAYAGLAYSDSDNTSPDLLAALGDGNTTSGGVVYGA